MAHACRCPCIARSLPMSDADAVTTGLYFSYLCLQRLGQDRLDCQALDISVTPRTRSRLVTIPLHRADARRYWLGHQENSWNGTCSLHCVQAEGADSQGLFSVVA